MTLSTHVLDAAQGTPAAGITVTLYRIEGSASTRMGSGQTNADGRIASPFGGELKAGVYELRFAVGEYYEATGTPSFFDEIPVRFAIDQTDRHYHVPLLLSPFAYSTYRGS